MKPHHEKAIKQLTESLKKKNRFLALIIGGSIAKRSERDDSDIDVIIVVSDKEFEKRKRSNRIFYYTTKFCDYPGGYIDGKIVSIQFLKDVLERGSEPARDAFRDAWIAFSKIPELEKILRSIPIYPKEEKEERMGKFWAQFEAAKWYIGEAEKRNDKYLLSYAVTNFILFAGRLILAYNEILFPFHKLFLEAIREAPKKPENFMELIENFLNDANSKNAQLIYDALNDFSNWIKTPYWAIRYMKDVEWSWMNGTTSIGEL